jgi:hypothetical protein
MVGEVTGWMKDVEKTLLKSDGLRGRYDGQVLLICTIFLWTCSLLKVSPGNSLIMISITRVSACLD